jgi:hypothetical protein
MARFSKGVMTVDLDQVAAHNPWAGVAALFIFCAFILGIIWIVNKY